MRKPRFVVLVLFAALAVVAAACSKGGGGGGGGNKPFVAAWIYVGPTNDAGWTEAHDNGRKLVQQQLGSDVKTIFKQNVPEGPQVSQVIDNLVNQGAKIIFATSFGFQDAVAKAAAKYPDVKFEQATGTTVLKNMSEYFGAAEDGDYLTGIAAGAASKTGKIGFVAPFPIPEVIREINAFTLGAQSVHKGATVQVVWTNTWFDPAKERQAAQSLVSAGVDTLGDGQDSPATGEVAKANNLPWSGYDSNQLSFAPQNWLTATNYNWGPYYVREVKAAMDGSWKSHFYYGSLKDGLIKLAPYGSSVDSATRQAIEAKKQALINGSFYEFAGPITKQDGSVGVPAGQRLTVKQLYAIDWFVQGVIGNPGG
jgi:basic membrane protein A and related proteins